MTITSFASSPNTASTLKRLLLAWYLDFLLYSVVATLASYSATWAFGTTWAAQLIGFGLLRSVIGRFMETPGMMLLGILRDGTRDTAAIARESWLTMLVGTLFILEGAKRAVRWTEYPRTLPDFGIIPDETGQMVLSLAWAAGFIAAGCLILRMRATGLWLGIVLTAAGLISVAWSWQVWDQAIAQEVAQRRAAQGRTLRPGEIEFMQRLLPIALIVGNGVALCVLASIRRRFVAR